MTKIQTSQKLNDFKGNPLKQGDQEMTVGDVIAIILSGKVSNPTLGYILGKKFANDKEVELKAEDAAFVKESVERNEMFTAIITGQLMEIIDGKEEK